MHCICCDSKEIKSLGKLKSYDYYKCLNCGFRFIHPIPSKQEIEKFYNTSRVITNLSEAISKNIKKFEKETTSPKKDNFNNIIKSVTKVVNKNPLNILEIGSGYGYFVHYMNSLGHHAQGTEVTKDYAAAVNSVINGNVVYLDNQPISSHFQQKQFDFVYLEHVFEHVMHPEEILSEIEKIISNQGVLVMSVPNSDSLWSKIKGKRWPWATPPDHLYYYNLKSLEAILSKYNFKILSSEIGDYYFRSIYQMYSLHPYINFIRKKLGLKPKDYPYTYPTNLYSILILFPYWFLYPFLKLSKNSGNELTVYCVKKVPN